jgi:hypothetical protein
MKMIKMLKQLICSSWVGPGFAVEVGGVGELHAAFFPQNRTPGQVRRSVALRRRKKCAH